MANDRQIDVKITATTDQLNRGILTANSALKDLQNQLSETASSGVSANFDEAANSMKGLSLQTAGATREFIVLGHEVVSGNFSRIPGSLLVLGERMGGLQFATLGWAAAVAASAAVLYKLVSGAEQTQQAMDLIQNKLELTGRGYLENALDVNQLVSTLHNLPGVSKQAAEAMVAELAGSSRISSEQITFLTENVGKFAQMSGQAVPKALKELAEAIDNPFTAFKKLDDQYNILSVSQAQTILKFEEQNDKTDAAAVLMDALGTRLKTAHDNMTPLQTATGELKTSWDHLLESFGNSGPIKWLDETGLPTLVHWLAEAFDATERFYTALGLTFDLQKKLLLDAAGIKQPPAAASAVASDNQKIYGANEVNPMDQEALDEAARRKKDAAEKKGHNKAPQSDEAEQRRIYTEDYDYKKQMDELKVQSGELTQREELKDLMQQLDVEHNEISASFDRQMKLYSEDAVQYKRLLSEKTVADQKYNIEHTKLTQQLTKEDNKNWESSIKTIEGAFDQMTTGILRGTQTIQGAFLRLAGNLVISMLNATAKISFDWIKRTGEEVAATAAGEQAKVAAKTAGAAEGKAVDDAMSSAEIHKDALKAGAGAYSALVGIPIIGPIIAPIAGAVAFAAVAAYDSFEVGTPYVPKTGLAMIHEGERITTADENRKGNNRGGGDVHLHVHALDHRDVKRYVNQNAHIIAKAVGGSIRNGNRSFAR